MQACSLEPAEDLVARIEMEKQPTVNKPLKPCLRIQIRYNSNDSLLFSLLSYLLLVSVQERQRVPLLLRFRVEIPFIGVDTPADKSGLSRILPTYISTLARCLWRNLLSLQLYFFFSPHFLPSSLSFSFIYPLFMLSVLL